jgi:diacylglycerol kinase (ATP)
MSLRSGFSAAILFDPKRANMPTKIILNPYSNRWNAQKRWESVQAELQAAGVVFDLAISAQRTHPIELAEQAVKDGYTTIIAAGGDGTVGDVVNGIVRAAGSTDAPLPATLGILPLGTGNDLCATLGIPLDISQAVGIIAAGNARPLDLCRVNQRYFLNNSAIGLEPYVTTIQDKIGWIKGIGRYLVATLQAIGDNPQWQARVEWDDGMYEGKISLVTVGNGKRSGGIFYMIPHAEPDDGKLTFVYAHRASRLDLLAMLPKTLKPAEGSYVYEKEVYELETTRLKVTLATPSPAHTDGELFTLDGREFEYEIYPARVNMLLP